MRPRAAGALLVGVLLVACVMRSPITVVGPLVPAVSADLRLTSTAAGVLTTVPLLAFAASSAAVPRVADHLGLRRTLFAALLLLAAGSGLRWHPSAAALFTGTALLGVAIAVVNVLLPALLRQAFPARVALLTSGYVVVMGLAGSAASGLAVPVADGAPGGWRTALAVWALPALLAAAVWSLQLRRPEARVPRSARARAPWRSPLAWAVTAFMGAQSVTFYVLIAWLPTVLVERSGLDEAAAGWHLSLVQGAGVLASLLVPAVATSARRARRTGVAGSLLTGTGYALLLLAPGWTVAASVVVGAGGGITVVSALAAISSRAVDASGAAALSGMAQSVGYLLAALGPVAVGALHAGTGSWTLPLVLMTAVGLLQAFAARAAGRDAVVLPAR
ncbi:MFS transporter [Kineococcus terrestris]|uniref:MFS transporter n=1 Tax=Kineococcus terrestris TaxID=2044856 RepID=UPI0034DAF07E